MCETKRLLATVAFANADDYKNVYCVLWFFFFFFFFILGYLQVEVLIISNN